MILINLLPVRARKQKADVRQFVAAYAAAVLVLFVLMAGIWFYKDRQIAAAEARSKQLELEIKKYAKYEPMLKDLTAKKELVDKKRSVVEGLEKDRDKLVRILALLSVEIPADRMWFEKFSESQNTLSIEGVALANETIADFMRNLESSPYIEKGSVNLTHSRRTEVSGKALREFKLTLRFLPFSAISEKLKVLSSAS